MTPYRISVNSVRKLKLVCIDCLAEKSPTQNLILALLFLETSVVETATSR